ncbi:hypothetical protein [Mastigocoleus sp. MO_188.B34]|nr:hypothetical protein [Mastigocoleus sp. MO_188.B34]MDJ0695680.1 hypothetical protein [Mastigocoleus sp. MO_188.B34]
MVAAAGVWLVIKVGSKLSPRIDKLLEQSDLSDFLYEPGILIQGGY